LDQHFKRLTNGLDVLKLDVPKSFTLAFFRKEILRLTGSKKEARVRFTAFRGNGGLYTPVSDQLNFLITASKLQQPSYSFPSKGLKTITFSRIPLTFSVLSSIKTMNSLPYVLAAKQKKILNIDDLVLLNNSGRVSEASSSNIVIWNGKTLITPSLKEACIAGIIRSVLLERIADTGLKIKEKKVTIDDLNSAKAVFLTNSIQGVKWVRKFETRSYDKKVAKQVGKILIEVLNTEACRD
jgi:branched-chain amino acid aminotransferase